MSRPELEAKLKEIRDHNIVNGEIEVIEDLSEQQELSEQE
jgi:hypothetical protein